jgi:two-component system NtrC family sensor kinase
VPKPVAGAIAGDVDRRPPGAAQGGRTMRHPIRHLSIKLFLVLVSVMLVLFSIHTYFDIRTISANLTDQVYSSAARASDIIVRSTRYGMLLNRKEDVHQTIRTVGNEPGFVEINIYNKDGGIIFSTDSLRIATRVDLQAEACVACHTADSPLTSVPAETRRRIYDSGSSGRILGLINPIRNEPECSNAPCHAHDSDQTILGVLDVKMSLATVDERVISARRGMVGSAIALTLLVASISGLFIYRVVRRPVRKLRRGMRKIASGDLDARIQLDSNDELGELAETFNLMAGDLKTAREELQEWAHKLEERIQQKSSALDQAQSQLIHMEKMASLGKLSASVAHEINNPLFSILTYAKLIRRRIDEGELNEEAAMALRKQVIVIENESSRCGDIVKGLLDFSHRTGVEFEPNSLRRIIERALSMLRHHLEMRQIDVTREYNCENDELLCDGRQIQQAIIAPCINSIEAMPQGGTLTIRTSSDDSTVTVAIIDTGVGIPREVISRIFEPFFTTKEGEAGLGLGLAVAYGVVQRHAGWIDIDSVRDRGTTLSITLPREPNVEGEDVNIETSTGETE